MLSVFVVLRLCCSCSSFFPFLAEELLVPLALVLRDGGCPLFFPFLHRSSGAAESWSRVLIYRGSELHGLQFGT